MFLERWEGSPGGKIPSLKTVQNKESPQRDTVTSQTHEQCPGDKNRIQVKKSNLVFLWAQLGFTGSEGGASRGLTPGLSDQNCWSKMAPDTSAAGGGQQCFTGHAVSSRWRLAVQRHCTQHTDLGVNCSSPAKTVEEIHHKVAPPTTCYREHVFWSLGSHLSIP